MFLYEKFFTGHIHVVFNYSFTSFLKRLNSEPEETDFKQL